MQNEELVKKADFQLSALTTDGGVLEPKKFEEFVGRAVAATEFLPLARTTTQGAPEDKIPKLKFVGRVAHYMPTAGVALSEAQRSAPVTSEITLSTKKFMAECAMPTEVFEDNVMQERLEAFLIDYFGKLIGRDTQDNVVNGDTTSATTDLTAFNGMRAAVTTNLVNAASAALSIDMLEEAMTSLPDEFRGAMDKLAFFMSDVLVTKYRRALAARATSLGDQMMVSKGEYQQLGLPFKGITNYPVDLGLTGNLTDVVLTDPENVVVSYWRKVVTKKLDLTREDKVTFVWSYRVGCALEEEEAAVKIYNVLCA